MKLEKKSSIRISKTIVVYKFISGIIELFVGITILTYGNSILYFYNHFRIGEILEDPHDLMVSLVDKLAPYILAHKIYVVLFLIVLGTVKITGAIGLLYDKEWGLDLLVVFFALLLPFDLYSLFTHPTFSKLIYLLINVLIAFYLIEFKPHKYFRRVKRLFEKNKRLI